MKHLVNAREFRLRAEELLDVDQKKIWDRLSGPPFAIVVGEPVTP